MIAAVDEILDTGATRVLRTEVDSDRSLAERSRPARRDEEDERAFAETAREFVERARSVRGDSSDQIDPLESVLADELLSAWVSGGESRGEAGKDIVPGDRPAAAVTAPGVGPVAAPVRIRLRIVPGNIAHCHDPGAVEERRAVDDPVPIDAVAVGIYENLAPGLGGDPRDRPVHRPRFAPHEGVWPAFRPDRPGRGAGRAGNPDPDSGPAPQGTAPPGSRHIVLVGMGVVGRFGVSEAMRTARETAWYLGRVGKKHLATLLIGAGTGNLSPQVGMRETLRGIARAVNEARSSDPTTPHLEVVTIVELYQDRIRDQYNAVVKLVASWRKSGAADEYGVLFDYEKLSEDQLKAYDEAGVRRLCEIERQRIADRAATGGSDDAANQEPTRISVEQVEGSFWFSALTATASIPVRQVEIDPLIVDEQNNLVVAATTMDAQVKAGASSAASSCRPTSGHSSRRGRGRSERRLGHGAGPLGAGRRRHARVGRRRRRAGAGRRQPGPGPGPRVHAPVADEVRTDPRAAPHPAATPARLVVADPAPDAPWRGAGGGVRGGPGLRGLQQAGDGRPHPGHGPDRSRRGDEVPGPRRVARRPVRPSPLLRALLLRPCRAPGLRLAVCPGGHRRRAPRACRPGAAPRRPSPPVRLLQRLRVRCNALPPRGRSSALAPAFAETFFERGVNNFVCTGWPVGDAPARLFARVFYGAMLGLELTEDNGRLVPEKVATGPVDLAEALCRARVEVRKLPGGLRTWGAYQHYGNPFKRFLAGRGEGPAPMRTAELRPRPFPAGPRTGPAAPQGGGEAPPPPGPASSFARVEDVIKRRGDELRQIPGVVDVRPGYRFEDDWITNEPAVVLAVVGTPAARGRP